MNKKYIIIVFKQFHPNKMLNSVKLSLGALGAENGARYFTNVHFSILGNQLGKSLIELDTFTSHCSVGIENK